MKEQELLKFIDDRIAKLEIEKKSYWDRMRRGIEITAALKELKILKELFLKGN